MEQEVKDIIKHEFIGKKIRLDSSSNNDLVGIKGKVIDETKNTFLIETGEGRKTVPKKHNRFVFDIGRKKIRIDGNKLMLRPEDRVKLKVKA